MECVCYLKITTSELATLHPRASEIQCGGGFQAHRGRHSGLSFQPAYNPQVFSQSVVAVWGIIV